jgi:hypothetical protein
VRVLRDPLQERTGALLHFFLFGETLTQRPVYLTARLISARSEACSMPQVLFPSSVTHTSSCMLFGDDDHGLLLSNCTGWKSSDRATYAPSNSTIHAVLPRGIAIRAILA